MGPRRCCTHTLGAYAKRSPLLLALLVAEALLLCPLGRARCFVPAPRIKGLSALVSK